MKNEFSRRSSREEVMDDFALRGEDLKKTLHDLDRINKWLGGNKVTLEGIEKVARSTCYAPPLRILDVGCGNGTLLKQVADLGKKRGWQMQLSGIDANPHAVQLARENTKDYPNISFRTMDVFAPEFNAEETDIVLCTLTLHHFEDEEIVQLLRQFLKISSMGIVINDLQRSKTAYHLFKAFCTVFIDNDIAREDGLLSIQKSFRKEELMNYGKQLNVRKQEISWKWAFRFQWILMK